MTTPEQIKNAIGRTPIAFVSSKYAGDIEANRQKAVEYTRMAVEMGFIPITPHLYLPEILDDSRAEQRKKAQTMCLELVIVCDVFLQCGDMPETSFMVEELAQALRINKPIMRVAD